MQNLVPRTFGLDRFHCIWNSAWLLGQISFLYFFHAHSEVYSLTLCDKVCQWLAAGRWFSPGTPVSSTNKTDRHHIVEILLNIALKIITLAQTVHLFHFKSNNVFMNYQIKIKTWISFIYFRSSKRLPIKDGFHEIWTTKERRTDTIWSVENENFVKERLHKA